MQRSSLLLLVLLLTAFAAAAGTSATKQTPGGEIVVSLQLEEDQLHEIRSDGRGHRMLTFEPYASRDPVEDRSGRRIAYSSRRSGQWEVYVRTHGGAEVNVSRHQGADYEPSWSPDGRSLVFVSNRGGKPGLYVIRSDGSGLRRLTRTTIGDYDPAWSPDGGTVAFTRLRNENEGDIWIVRAAGGPPRRLTRDERDNWGPRWSPDGRTLAYTSRIVRSGEFPSRIRLITRDGRRMREVTTDRENGIEQHLFPTWSPDGKRIAFFRTRGEHGLWVMSADGRNLRKIPTSTSDDFLDLSWSRSGRILYSSSSIGLQALVGIRPDTGQRRLLVSDATQPRWSRDGRQLAFVRHVGRAGTFEVLVSDDSGANVRNVTRHPAADELPSWSPDGSRIAYSTERGGDEALVDVYTSSSDGTDPRPLAVGPENEADPDWSPDGSTVLFARFPPFREKPPPGDVYAIDIATGVERRLTDHPATDELARWSPDGRSIVFMSERTGRRQLFLMNADGSDQRPFLASASHDTSPAWSPDGRHIAFTRFRAKSVELWIANADGTGASRLGIACASEDCLEHHPSPSWRDVPSP